MTAVAPAINNPFATRWTRPGRLPYRFVEGSSAAGLIDLLQANDWRGEIVGPHGTGKSTLLATLLPPLAAAGRAPLVTQLHDGQRKLPGALRRSAAWSSRTQVIVDGYEQLSHWSRAVLRRRVRRAGAGLLVTAHRPTGLPLLLETKPSAETLAALAGQLQADDPRWVGAEDARASFYRHKGNLREALFDLYDLYEQRNRRASPTGKNRL